MKQEPINRKIDMNQTITSIYISGPLLGVDKSISKNRYSRAEMLLKKTYNCRVINPLNRQVKKEVEMSESIITESVKDILKCDTIYMLNQWHESKEARIDMAIAKELNKTIIYQKTCAY